MARFAAGGRGGRGRGRRPHPARGKPQAGPGAAIVDQEQSASYRPMGAALTIQEVGSQSVSSVCLCRAYKASLHQSKKMLSNVHVCIHAADCR